MEVTLDTSGYKPDELKVEIKGGELCVEGKHEERRWRGVAPPSRLTMLEAALKEGRRKCLQERKARTSPTKAAWTTLRAQGRCRGGGGVFPRLEGRGTRAEPGRRSP